MAREPGAISGVGHPTDALRARLGKLYGETKVREMDRVLDDAVAIDVLANLIRTSCEKHATTDGRLDYRDVAVDVIAAMRKHQRT